MRPNFGLPDQLVLKGSYFPPLFIRGEDEHTPADLRAAAPAPGSPAQERGAVPAPLTLYLCTSCQNSTSFSRKPPFR